MSQPYPGAYHGGPPTVPVAQPRYRSLRRTAIVSVVLMGLTALAAVLQSTALWTSYDEVKRLIYGLLSEDELDRGLESMTGAGPLLDLSGYLFLATGIAFLIWLWQARENTEILRPAAAYQGGARPAEHRHAQGWIVGGWVCPIVQFWYPLQVVEDVATASEPTHQPGMVQTSRVRTLLYTWWAAWVGFWVVLVGGGGVTLISFVGWIIRLADRVSAADATDDYVDIYDLQSFMVRVALGVNIGFTLATVLLIAAGVAISVLLFRITRWQDDRMAATGGVPLGPTLPAHSPSHLPNPHAQQTGAPQYAPRPAFPSYSPRQQTGQETYGPEAYGGGPGGHTYGPGPYRGSSGYLQPSSGASVGPSMPNPAPYGPGGYGGTTGSSPTQRPPADDPSAPPPRADHPTGPTSTNNPSEKPHQPGGATPWQPPH
ncbi:uncharacterized protein DUF4328 [Kribbella amoyensis]|uniref:Uncharacterized protein DUF4328 n=1 Tax=Kribbella amoyensis TaxID=996641 RepID=A0A561BP22_9ACTN|nr:DUF4328 domain-containing protein [Kribbella amoyensis]TWD80618.1 uncharacterized protein DUF4328 [Kribbella amoyensis]